jgi:ribonuclease Z
MIRVTFLGTAASRPTVRRNVSAIAIQREGDHMLFDCGEGTQRQMMRYGTGFTIGSVFVTHMHADHFLGITGLLRTMALQGREDGLSLYGPIGAKRVLNETIHLGVERLPFPVEIHELNPEDRVTQGDYEIRAFAVNHGTPALGYALLEQPRLGRFDVDRARELGIPEGPLFGALHRGDPVEVDGRTVYPDNVVGEERPGRTMVYTGDTRPAESTIEIARDADLLIHEATFGFEDVDRAHETFHTTAKGAAELARRAGVRSLILTHLSARYADDPAPLLEEARASFPNTVVAYDGLTLEIPYPEESEEDLELGTA